MRLVKKSFSTVIFALISYFLQGQSSPVYHFFHPDSLRRMVEVIASDSLEGRYTGTTGNLKAALCIADQFRNAGLSHVAGNNGFFMEIKPSWLNVMGAIEGKSRPGQVIIFSAHYDHVGTINTNPFSGSGGNAVVEKGDEIFNGANDNASGVAAVISLARFLKEINNNERTLIFIAFTGEELGLLGSQYLAENIEPDSIVAMINIEMIGRKPYSSSRPYVTGHEQSDLIKILNSNYQLHQDKKEKKYFRPDPYIGSFLFQRSDNYPFAKKGIPAHTIMLSSPKDEYYHTPDDEPATLDYKAMAEVIRAVAAGVQALVTGADTPRRIKNF